MNNVSAKEQFSRRLSKLAVLTIVFWGLSSSSHLGAAPVWLLQADLPPHITSQVKTPSDGSSFRVLSEHDTVLYRAAFAAQEKADWTFADKALEQVTNKGLVGHVLAGRYLHSTPTLDEAKLWLSSYSFLPQAKALYTQAKRLSGFTGAKIQEPTTVTQWQGNHGFSSFSAFPSANDNDEPTLRSPIRSEINAALRRGDPLKARLILISALNRGALPIARAGDFNSRIAAALYYEGETQTARTMARMAAKSGSPLGLWIEGLSAWKQHDFGTAAHSFAALSKITGLSPWNRATSSYWAYRATSRLGDKTEAHRFLAEAAKVPHSFYGAMAARLLGHSNEYSWLMPELDAKSFSLLKAQPAGWRALALIEAGRNDLAESELRQLLSEGSRPMQAAALALAEKARMPSLTLQLSSVTSGSNGKPFDAALYPLPPWQPSKGFKVDRALVYAIMRHESQFDPEAVSSRGACGLMQIMPSTARHISNSNRAERGTKSRCADTLLDPETNIDMGHKYIRILSETPMIGDNLLFLLTAYNAGPGNLARWINSGDRSDPLLFIESLPVRETREYVQQVMIHYWMYRSRLSKPDAAVADLARGEWPRFALRDEAPAKRAGIALEGLELASLEPVKMSGTR